MQLGRRTCWKLPIESHTGKGNPSQRYHSWDGMMITTASCAAAYSTLDCLVALIETLTSHFSLIHLCHCCGYMLPSTRLTVHPAGTPVADEVAARSCILHDVDGKHRQAQESDTVGSNLLSSLTLQKRTTLYSAVFSHRHPIQAFTWT